MKRATTSWSNEEKAALVEQIVLQRVTLRQACDMHGLSSEELRSWVRIFRQSARRALDRRLRDTLTLQGLDLDGFDFDERGPAVDENDPSIERLAKLLSELRAERRQAVIVFTLEGRQSQIWCRHGEVLDAKCGFAKGASAFYKIACSARGTLTVHPWDSQRQRSIHSGTPNLLATCAERMKKRKILLRALGGPDSVMQCRETIDGDWAQLDPGDQALLSLCNGVRPIDLILLDHIASDLSTLQTLVRLRKAGWLRRVNLATPERPLNLSLVSTANGISSGRSVVPLSTTLRARRSEKRAPYVAVAALVSTVLGAVAAVAYHRHSTATERANAELAAVEACPASMVHVVGGAFSMGDASANAMPLSRPAHQVQVSSFCIDRFEATMGQYEECVDAGVCEAVGDMNQRAGLSYAEQTPSARLHNAHCNYAKPGREAHPMNCVSQPEAARYCAFRGARLATEAEWEFAARGPEARSFPWGNQPPSASRLNACGTECQRWHSQVGLGSEASVTLHDGDDGFSATAPVGSFPNGATPEGIHDLAGNVFEWTAGGLYPYSLNARHNPVGPSSQGLAVIRGGSFKSGNPTLPLSSSRFELAANKRSPSVGMRCVALPGQEAALASED